jgi:hypothetical protein
MEFLQRELFGSLLEFLDTMDYGNLLSVSKLLHEKCSKYKKTRYPFIVVKNLFLFGDSSSLSTECIDTFHHEQILKFGTSEKISKNMPPYLHQLLFTTIARASIKTSKPVYPLDFYTVPWRFRKCIDSQHLYGDYYPKINTEIYISSCLDKCDEIIKDTPMAKRKEMESVLFQKIIRKHKKSKTAYKIEMDKFNTVLNKKFSK